MSTGDPPAISPGRFDAPRLFLLGFLTLFLELVLIRYLAGNIWNLGYFPNLVLLAVFLGMGFGFLLHHLVPRESSPRLYHGAALTLLLLILFVRFFSPSFPSFGTSGGEIGGEIYFTGTPEVGGIVSYFQFGIWFLSVAVIFALISQRTAKLFRLFPPLVSYTLDISGSVCGILTFMLLSWYQVPAPYWFLIAVPFFMGAMERGPVKLLFYTPLSFALIFLLALSQDSRLLWEPYYQGSVEVHWSPYQKIEYTDGLSIPSWKKVYVNGIQHQDLYRLEELPRPIYMRPHEYRKEVGLEPYRTVLIIGAGTGNDVAAALANGAEIVDAVEIDPVIAELGRRYHPEQPYSDPRVNLIVDDGRAFMARTERRYDLIIFALTDSLIRVSAMSQLRLENYLFTDNSIRRAYGLLSETGDISLYNEYRRAWLVEKYQKMIHVATGKYPRVIFQRGTIASLLVGRLTSAEAPPALSDPDIDIPTDDWPFPYLKKRGMPGVYMMALVGVGLLVFAMALLQRRLSRIRGEARVAPATKVAFFLMGVAFLLLET
ncbi:MAG: hypothetical protein O6952_00790, partial [Planctomycetota bacterium]|nr:hypothetical protein [Planctomycetota bacterium]